MKTRTGFAERLRLQKLGQGKLTSAWYISRISLLLCLSLSVMAVTGHATPVHATFEHFSVEVLSSSTIWKDNVGFNGANTTFGDPSILWGNNPNATNSHEVFDVVFMADPGWRFANVGLVVQYTFRSMDANNAQMYWSIPNSTFIGTCCSFEFVGGGTLERSVATTSGTTTGSYTRTQGGGGGNGAGFRRFWDIGEGTVSVGGAESFTVHLEQNLQIYGGNPNSLWMFSLGVGPTLVEAPTTPVPEPTSLALLSTGALFLLGYGWRRRRQEQPKGVHLA